MLVVHFCGYLYPLPLKVAKRKVVDEHSSAALACVACVYYLNAAVAAILVATGAYRYQWRAVVALLCFQLVNVAEFSAWTESCGQSELPFENLDYLFIPGIRKAVEENVSDVIESDVSISE